MYNLSFENFNQKSYKNIDMYVSTILSTIIFSQIWQFHKFSGKKLQPKIYFYETKNISNYVQFPVNPDNLQMKTIKNCDFNILKIKLHFMQTKKLHKNAILFLKV